MRAFTFSLSLLLIAFLLGAAPALRAQAQCGVVTGVSFPVDRSVFQLVQDYAVPSARHQGRYHTGEDYYAGPGQSFGQPVRVIADGRVTYSSPIGWGRDGGVVIVEHTMPDGTLVYSLYGHMIPTDTYPFPERYRCLRAGDVVGAIGDARPAPHIHFEIRTTGPDIPGPGYSIQPPAELGWLQPSRFILNWQTWLLSAHRWHVQLPEDNRLVTPPLILDDGSMLLASRDRLRYASADGRILWRIILDQTPVALTLVDRRPVVVYPNGNLQFINLDASLGERWSVSVPLQSPALPFADRLLFHSADDTLLALTPDRRQIAWQQSGI
ncbi:MAG: peptidoglycan DD-metalloendopeptidase family protein, partial [Anaerolineae bacterium]|nr:peptidoglycan DD-metalloendopeptidase family protein [Anaerolineae bacterium]